MSDLKRFLANNTLALVGTIVLAILLLAVLIGPFFLPSPLAITFPDTKVCVPG